MEIEELEKLLISKDPNSLEFGKSIDFSGSDKRNILAYIISLDPRSVLASHFYTYGPKLGVSFLDSASSTFYRDFASELARVHKISGRIQLAELTYLFGEAIKSGLSDGRISFSIIPAYDHFGGGERRRKV